MRLRITENDLPPNVSAMLSAHEAGDTVLDDEVVEAVLDALPAIIAVRVRRFVPPGFKLSGVDLAIELTGSLQVAELGGQVVVHLTPQ